MITTVPMVALLSSVGLAFPALAQTAGAAAADPAQSEIIVTATRRAERLQDVPVSVSAFSQKKLDAQGLRSIDDLSRFAPGVTFTRNGLSGNYNDASNTIAIRGIDSSAGAATTGIYVDDTPIQSRRIGFGTQNVYPQLFDLERVEVLRGPQGTLFGAGSEGGTVRFIAPAPSLTAISDYGRAEVSGTENGAPSYEVGAALGGPLIEDKLGLRVSASFRRDGGYVDRVDPANGRVTEHNSNSIKTFTARAALKWPATDSLTVSPSFYYQRQYVNDTGAYWAQNPNLSDRSHGVFNNGNALRNTNTDPFYLAALRLDYNLGWSQLVSNTSYFSRSNRANADYTQFDRALYLNALPAPGDAAVAAFTDRQKNFYQELRLQSANNNARLTYTIGVFYAHLHENSTEFVTDPTLNAETGFTACSDALPCPGGLIYSQPELKVVDEQIAGFGEARFKLTHTLSAAAGVRVSDVRYTSASKISGPFFGGAVNGSQSGHEVPVTPRFVLSFQPDRDRLFYVSASKGFRVGGVNTPVPGLCGADLVVLGVAQVPSNYSSDSLWSYELGAKLSGFNRRLTVNASAFLIEWSNIQQNVYLPSCGLQYTDNLGKVESAGGDIEIAARPIDPLTLGLTIAYTDAYYTQASTKLPTVLPIVSRGDRLRGAPWSVVASAEYRFSADEYRQPYVRADYQVSTKLTKLIPSLNPGDALSDTTLTNLPPTENLNVRAGVRLDQIDVSIFAQNLTNDLPVLFRSRDVAYPGSLYFERSARPRTFGLTVAYRR